MVELRNITVILTCCAFFLTSCVTDSGSTSGSLLGPQLSSFFDRSLFRSKVDDLANSLDRPRLNIVIPVFDPGLPENESEYEAKGIWPELRRAEALRFAYKLKTALEETGAFGAIRVTPDKTATGDLYVLGKIKESDGEDVEIDLEVFSIAGKRWFYKSFDHEVEPSFHANIRNEGKDAYDPVFKEAAEYLAEELAYHKSEELVDIGRIADLRFGASFVEDAFTEHLTQKNGVFALASFPSDLDPMLVRTKAIRVRDQLFVDSLQNNYRSFSEQMNLSYLVWQEQSLEELEAKRDAQLKAAGQAIVGILAIGLAIAAVAAGANSQDAGDGAVAITGGVVAGAVGAELLSKSFQTSKEAKVHREALKELGQSMDAELAPRVIAYEEQSVELTGTAQEQFAQWRSFLKRIYAQERTPQTQL